mgnify:CR=1 FL=1
MSRSLFDKCGGFALISKVVFAPYDKAVDSDIVGPYFDNIDMRAQVDNQIRGFGAQQFYRLDGDFTPANHSSF